MSNLLDDGCTVESILVRFDQNVILDSIFVSLFGSSDQGLVEFESGLPSMTISSTGKLNVEKPGGGVGNGFSVKYVATNGFSFDQFVIPKVPEPAILALMGLGLAGIGYRRRQIKSA